MTFKFYKQEIYKAFNEEERKLVFNTDDPDPVKLIDFIYLFNIYFSRSHGSTQYVRNEVTNEMEK